MFNTQNSRPAKVISTPNPNSKEFLQHLFKRENLIDTKNGLAYHNISERTRAEMVERIGEICIWLEYSDKTYFITICLLDRFLKACKIKCESSDIQLIAATCLMIASKFYEMNRINLKFTKENLLQNKYSSKIIKNTELTIFKTLKFHIGLPIVKEFIELYFQQKRIHKEVIDLSLFYAKVAVQDFELASLLPSQLAFCCIEAAENNKIRVNENNSSKYRTVYNIFSRPKLSAEFPSIEIV